MTEGNTARLEAALAGRYRIERKLGEGGMASVYLAEDPKHARRVALKILRPELAAVLGGERFLAEIRTTANLQHPHILPLFDSGEADGYLYYVMPYIDGETLRERLDRERQLGVEESVRIARDVADALDYAHRAGVIHRDIKPANILLHDGRPVVADFGIALAVSAAGGGRMTETGLSLGTPHYMSPEQASADRDLTARSDIYSLGCVLYEMLAGHPPHTGPSAQSVLVRILTEDPRALTELRHTVPSHVSAAVMKAIEKLPADRFESARDLRDALGDPSFTHAVPTAAPTTVATAVGAGRDGAPASWLADTRSKVAVALIVALGAVGGAALLTRTDAGSEPQPTVRAEVVLDEEITWATLAPRISADGRRVAFATPDGIRVRDVDQPRFRLLPGTEGTNAWMDLSPDGEWVAFADGGNLLKVSTTASSPISLARIGAEEISDMFWGDDGTIVFGTDGGAIWRVSDTGGDAERLTDRSAGIRPTILPDGSAIILTTYQQSLSMLDLATREVVPLVDEAVGGRYAPSGHVLYTHPEGGLFALPFDLSTRRVGGPPTPVLDDVGVTGSDAHFDVSSNGTLFFTTGVSSSNNRLIVLLSPGGVADTVRMQPTAVAQLALSPDGRRLAYTTGGGGRTDDRQIWIYDVVLESHRQLSFEGGHQPQWSPDGAYVAYSSEGPDTDDEDLWLHAVDGASDPRHLRLGMASDEHAERWPVDTVLVFESSGDLYVVNPLADAPVARPFVQADYREESFDLHPSGRFAAYASEEYGASEIVVRDFPAPRGKWRISDGGGVDPRWSADGAAVYYLRPVGASIMRTEVRVGAEPTVLGTEVAWRLGTLVAGNWDFDPATGRAVVVVPAGSDRSPETDGEAWIVVNWFEELRRLTGGM